MKPILLSAIAALTLAGCGLTLPGKSFKYNGFECSKNDTKIEVDPSVLGAVGVDKTPPANAITEKELGLTASLMDQCTDFLAGKYLTESTK